MNELPGRADFLLRSDVLLLNNGSYGACPEVVLKACRSWQAEFERHPSGFMNRWADLLSEARTVLAEYLHTSQDKLAFVTNATMGVNVVAHSLRGLLRPGEEVLATNQEYGACVHAWQYNCAKAGAGYTVRSIDLPLKSEDDFVEQFWKGVTPRTKVVFLSHTTSPTALTFPVGRICRRARDAGIISVIDGAHVPGQRELVLEEIDADFYIGNCHKWMCSPKGTAFLFARPDVQSLIEPLIVGHGWASDHSAENPLVSYVEQFGTRDPSPFLGVPAAIDYMSAHDWPKVRERCHRTALAAKRSIEAHFNTESICPEHFDWFSQLCPIRLPDDTDLGKLGSILRNQYRIEIPLMKTGNVKIARLSVQIYNTQQEVDIFVDAVAAHTDECHDSC